jgi:hypothetical protein
LQVWMFLPLHCVAPGEQTPVQAPAEQANGQLWLSTQLPVESHVCATLPKQRDAPGEQIPPHVPLPVQT